MKKPAVKTNKTISGGTSIADLAILLRDVEKAQLQVTRSSDEWLVTLWVGGVEYQSQSMILYVAIRQAMAAAGMNVQ